MVAIFLNRSFGHHRKLPNLLAFHARLPPSWGKKQKSGQCRPHRYPEIQLGLLKRASVFLFSLCKAASHPKSASRACIRPVVSGSAIWNAFLVYLKGTKKAAALIGVGFSLSLLYQQYTCSTVNFLFTNVWQQCHEACSLDRSGDSMLTCRGTTALSTADDSALAINHFLEQFHVLVIDKHGTWTLTIHKNRIFFSGS